MNVASECGYTDEHYKDLQQLQKDFGPFHFNVLAFPCNQFGQQEPGSDKEIDSFVRRVYGVTFPIFSKIAVVGIGANNVYKYLVGESNRSHDHADVTEGSKSVLTLISHFKLCHIQKQVFSLKLLMCNASSFCGVTKSWRKRFIFMQSNRLLI